MRSRLVPNAVLAGLAAGFGIVACVNDYRLDCERASRRAAWLEWERVRSENTDLRAELDAHRRGLARPDETGGVRIPPTALPTE
jgi:hypothetical protein